MKKKIFKILILVVLVGFGSRSVFAGAEYQSQSFNLFLDFDCHPKLEYSVSISPTSLDLNNTFLISVTQLDDQGQVITQLSHDYPVAIPQNGIVNNSVISLTQQINTQASYRVAFNEYNQYSQYVDMSEVFDTQVSSANCVPETVSTDFESNLDMSIDINIENPINVDSVPSLVQTIFQGLIKIGIPLLVVMIVYSGWLYLLARGNSSKIQEAHTMLTYTLIGGALLLGSWALVELIHSTFLELTAYVINNIFV